MLSSSLYAMLKLSKTSSPQKLFDNDCVTLYNSGLLAEGCRSPGCHQMGISRKGIFFYRFCAMPPFFSFFMHSFNFCSLCIHVFVILYVSKKRNLFYACFNLFQGDKYKTICYWYIR